MVVVKQASRLHRPGYEARGPQHGASSVNPRTSQCTSSWRQEGTHSPRYSPPTSLEASRVSIRLVYVISPSALRRARPRRRAPTYVIRQPKRPSTGLFEPRPRPRPSLTLLNPDLRAFTHTLLRSGALLVCMLAVRVGFVIRRPRLFRRIWRAPHCVPILEPP